MQIQDALVEKVSTIGGKVMRRVYSILVKQKFNGAAAILAGASVVMLKLQVSIDSCCQLCLSSCEL